MKNSVAHCIAKRSTYVAWNATCRALIPVPTVLCAAQAARRRKLLAAFGPGCVYCGDFAETRDHLRPVMRRGMPTGYCNDDWNIVPCCATCNWSKGNSTWRQFMARRTGMAPLARGVPSAHVAARVRMLEAFQRASRPQRWFPARYLADLLKLRASMERAMGAHGFMAERLRACIEVGVPHAAATQAPQRRFTAAVTKSVAAHQRRRPRSWKAGSTLRRQPALAAAV